MSQKPSAHPFLYIQERESSSGVSSHYPSWCSTYGSLHIYILLEDEDCFGAFVGPPFSQIARRILGTDKYGERR
jgi:hypothetical protein